MVGEGDQPNAHEAIAECSPTFDQVHQALGTSARCEASRIGAGFQLVDAYAARMV